MPDRPDLKRSPRRPTPPGSDRLPPHSAEAEQGVLGCVIIDAQHALPECIDRFKRGSDVFYDLRHRSIYETCLELYGDNEPIDIITLTERLKCWGKLEQVGGVAVLSALMDCVVSPANIPEYARIVQEKFVMRQMIRTCTEVVGRMYEAGGADLDELMDLAERDILQISESRIMFNTSTVRELVQSAISDIEAMHQRQGCVSGLRTGFNDLDRMTDGLHPGEMVVIAARPSIGKTSLLLNICEHVAIDQQLPVGIISMEMSGKQLILRMMCSRSRVNLRNVREGFLAERDFPKITTAAGRITQAPIHIDDTAGQPIIQIRAKARRWWQQHEIKLLGIDYLQLANAQQPGRRYENRQQEVSQISIGIKNLAKELNIPVIALCQLNRDIERDKNRHPRLSDLRESGSLEQDSDVVGMLYKPKQDDDEDEHGDVIQTNMLIAKNRNGPTGEVRLVFQKSITRFESVARVSDADAQEQHTATAPLPYTDT